MSAALKTTPRNELARRRSGVRVGIRVPKQIARMIDASMAKYGVTKTQVVVAALMRHFAEDGGLPDIRELMKLGRAVLTKSLNGG